MTRRKKPVEKKKHPEVQGLLVLSLSILLFVASISFIDGEPAKNWLGVLGYFSSLCLQYFLGLGVYPFLCFVGYLGSRLLFHKPIVSKTRTFLFFLLLLSFCMLLTTIAETFPKKADLFEGRVFTEKVTLLTPQPKEIIRYNLGGVPAYFLYRDIPYFSLNKLLSPLGTFITFSMLFFISFFLLTKIRLGYFGKIAIYLSCKTLSAIASIFYKTKSFISSFDITYFYQMKKKPEPPKQFSPKVHLTPPVKETHLPPRKKRTERKKAPGISQIKMTANSKSKYDLPPPHLLTNPEPVDQSSLKKDLQRQAKVLEDTLQNFGIEGKVRDINCGPTITSFEVQPPVGVKVQKIKTLESDIALSMEAKSIRILAPIPGKALVGVEVPSLNPQAVSFKEMLLHYQDRSRKNNIPIMLGKTVAGDFVIADLVKMPHCLIAGATGSGKSVCINTIVMSILMNARPDEIKLLMIDPKKVELTQYSNLPHMIAPVISEAHGAYAALQWLVREMHVRYEILKQLGLRNISAFNSRKPKRDIEESLPMPIPEHMPLIVSIIDEFADLMMVSSSDLETPIARIAQMARAVGIHLILATQRPSREVITGIIKANFPTRIAFKVSSRINSQIILDETGAESLLGNGDLLFLPPGSSTLVRAQGAYISDDDINQVVESICEQSPPNYLISSFDAMKKEEVERGDAKDSLYDKALEIVLASKSASTTYLQRKLKIGYARAASLIDELEENGVVGPQEGSRPRKVLQSPDSYLP